MDKDEEAVLRRLFAYNMAHKSVLLALIASHPEPKFLLKALRHYSEPANVGLLNSTFPDQHIAQYEEELKSFVSLAEKYAQT